MRKRSAMIIYILFGAHRDIMSSKEIVGLLTGVRKVASALVVEASSELQKLIQSSSLGPVSEDLVDKFTTSSSWSRGGFTDFDSFGDENIAAYYSVGISTTSHSTPIVASEIDHHQHQPHESVGQIPPPLLLTRTQQAGVEAASNGLMSNSSSNHLNPSFSSSPPGSRRKLHGAAVPGKWRQLHTGLCWSSDTLVSSSNRSASAADSSGSADRNTTTSNRRSGRKSEHKV